MGTEAGMLGVYNFQGVVLGGDGSNDAGRMGAGFCCLHRSDIAGCLRAFLSQAREFLFFPWLPTEASKRAPIFDRGTGSKPSRLRSGSLQADLSLIV